jgi:hypothetical protein
MKPQSHNYHWVQRGITISPQELFSIPGKRTREMIAGELKYAFSNGEIAQTGSLQLASFYPEVINDIYWHLNDERPDALAAFVDQLNLTLDHPGRRCSILLQDRELYAATAKTLEPALYSDPESIERILVAQKFNKDEEGEGFNFLLSHDEYLAKLEFEPTRYLRVTAYEKGADDAKLLKFLNWAEERKSKEAAAAYFWLETHPAKFAALNPDLLSALSKDEEYAFRTIVEATLLGLSKDLINPLLGSIRSARWTYHLMRNKVIHDTDDALAILSKDPVWLVEWLSFKNGDYEYLEKANDLANKNGIKSVTFREYMTWVKRKHNQFAGEALRT